MPCSAQILLLCLMSVSACSAGCVEVDSGTEAVNGNSFKINCISCKKRGETTATAFTEWLFKGKQDSDYTLIFQYISQVASIHDERFTERLAWSGTNHTNDIQDMSITITNVTFNHTGDYKCTVNRTLHFEAHEFLINVTKYVHLTVVEKGDGGYGCKPWLMTLLLAPCSEVEKCCNETHILTRHTIERTCGVLKSCFCCLHLSGRFLQYSTQKVSM
uniref:Sodium channel regulatory subunit beta-1 n=1 Tax=Geotrypetes seraphini TaxID=260995 RepID=A0A6P8NJH3_GEOSA|nr:sodium channel subunit beta-1 isoform X2 [Geotrypetes seraphini]